MREREKQLIKGHKIQTLCIHNAYMQNKITTIKAFHLDISNNTENTTCQNGLH